MENNATKNQEKKSKNHDDKSHDQVKKGKEKSAQDASCLDAQKEYKLSQEDELKKQIIELNKAIDNLKSQNLMLELENKKNIADFQAKAKGFEQKAQGEINKLKQELAIKYEAQKADLTKYGSQAMLEQVVDHLINIEKALEVGSKQENPVKAYVDGFKMLIDQINQELEQFGVTKIVPKVDEQFNPVFHHALSTIKGKVPNRIYEVKKIGFKLYDRVLKPAIVIIEV